MFQSLLRDDPRYCRLDSLEHLTSRIEQYVSDLKAASAHDKLVRVLVTVGDTEEECEPAQPRLALVLDLNCPPASDPRG